MKRCNWSCILIGKKIYYSLWSYCFIMSSDIDNIPLKIPIKEFHAPCLFFTLRTCKSYRETFWCIETLMKKVWSTRNFASWTESFNNHCIILNLRWSLCVVVFDVNNTIKEKEVIFISIFININGIYFLLSRQRIKIVKEPSLNPRRSHDIDSLEYWSISCCKVR